VPRAGFQPARPYGQEIFLPHYVTIAKQIESLPFLIIIIRLPTYMLNMCLGICLLWSGLPLYRLKFLQVTLIWDLRPLSHNYYVQSHYIDLLRILIST